MTTPVSLIGRMAQLGGLRAVLVQARFYAGLPPAAPDDTPAGALLGLVPLAMPSGTVGSDGSMAVLTLTCPQAAPALASGLIGFVRLATSDGAGILDVRAGLAADGLPAVVSVQQAYAGGEIQLLACVIRQ